MFSKLHLAILLIAPAILVGAVSSSAGAQPPSEQPYADEMASFMQAQMETYRIPGAALAIVHEGEIEYIVGFGRANAAGDPVTPDTPFLIASLSKSITALAIMQLVEAGQIRLDDPVQRHLPDFEVGGGQADAITVAQLLYHTAGFSTVDGNQANLSTDSLEDSVRALAARPLKYAPGEGQEYSNLSYMVLALLIQEVSGQSYEAYIEEHVFAPLGMSHSFSSLAEARAGGAASGYYPFFGIPLLYDSLMPYSQATQASGGLWSSASDMSRYLTAHLNGGRLGDVSILSAEGVASLHEPGYMFDDKFGYAMGWNSFEGFLTPEQLEPLDTTLKGYEQITVLFHEGDWAGYKAVMMILPEAEYGAVILMNTNDPLRTSALKFMVWDVLLIATGAEPQYFPPGESYLVQNSRWIFTLVVLVFATEMIWTLGRRKQLHAGTGPSSRRVALLHLFTPSIAGGGLLAYVLLILLPENGVTLPSLIRFTPDIGLLVVLMILLVVGWGLVRTVLLLRQINRVYHAGDRATPV